MKKYILSILFIISNMIISFGQRGRIGNYDSEPMEPISFSEATGPVGFGVCLFIVGLIIYNAMDNTKYGKDTGSCIMGLGVIIGLSGFFYLAVYGLSILLPAVVIIAVVGYFVLQVASSGKDGSEP